LNERRDSAFKQIDIFIDFSRKMNIDFMNEQVQFRHGDVDFFLFVADTNTRERLQLNDVDARNQILYVSASAAFNDAFAFFFNGSGVPFWHTT